jgi:selenocysteine lyase/cysteine desulfurase
MPSIYAARPALQLLSSIGLPNVAAQIAHLTSAFLRGARSLGIVSKTADSSVGPLVVLRSSDPPALVGRLNERGIIVSARRDGVRFSFHVYNNLDDVNTTLSALAANLHLLARL